MSAPRVAIDLGAGSGRALVGLFAEGALRLEEAHRFHYAPRRVAGALRWDMQALLAGVREGLRLAGTFASVGVDSWGVDYGLLDAEGRLLEEPFCYRDERTDGVMERAFTTVPRAELFARTGLQFQKFNTLYQLMAHAEAGIPPEASRLLMIPDLCHHFLCGVAKGEYTNATTTQLVDARTGRWDDELFARLQLPRGLMPELVPAGTRLGALRSELGSPSVDVIAPATHDTGSAVLGTPLLPGWAYISSGTWSLVGVELTAPLLHAHVERANFTNEGGAFGTVRFLKNVMGLWLLESCRKEWDGREGELGTLLSRVAEVKENVGTVDPDDARFFNPQSMVKELRSSLAGRGHKAPDDPVLLTKVVLDSLAQRYAEVVRTIEALTSERVPGIHVVGGGSQNDYLNQATANASGRPVLAGPVEATALGNLVVQAIAGGDVASLAEARQVVREAFQPRRFEPS